MSAILDAVLVVIGAVVFTTWLYVAARFVTRGILRTLDERRENRHE